MKSGRGWNHSNPILVILCVGWLAHWQPCVATKWSVATDDKCVFTVSGNWTILFKENPSLFVTYLAVADPPSCRKACCEHHTCNGYVFDASTHDDSCKLLKCSRTGTNCKKALTRFTKTSVGEVGFITGLADGAESGTSKTKEHESGGGDHDDHPVVVSDHGDSNGGQPGSNHKLSQEEDEAKDEPTPTAEIEQIWSNFTEYSNNYREDIKEHTNSISLTIAFLFGLGFLVTVFYLTGRRWYEGLKEGHQKGYTRISYLLNGV